MPKLNFWVTKETIEEMKEILEHYRSINPSLFMAGREDDSDETIYSRFAISA
jgi:hypothetical protein